MRLHEFLTEKEWQRLEQLIYETTWRALHAHQHRISIHDSKDDTLSTVYEP